MFGSPSFSHTQIHMHRHNGQSGKIIPFVVRVLARRRRRCCCCFWTQKAKKKKEGKERQQRNDDDVGGGRRRNNNELRNAVVSLSCLAYR